MNGCLCKSKEWLLFKHEYTTLYSKYPENARPVICTQCNGEIHIQIFAPNPPPPPPPFPFPSTVLQAPGESFSFEGVCPGQKVTPYRLLCQLMPKHMLRMSGWLRKILILLVLFLFECYRVCFFSLPFKSDIICHGDSFVKNWVWCSPESTGPCMWLVSF